MDLKTFKQQFDELLKVYVDEKTTQAKQLINNPKLNTFIDYIQTFIFSGGKRIRPFCLWSMYKGFGGQKDTDVLQFSIIFELLHSMALIHDDIIDQSEKRHNVPTMHRYIADCIGHGQSRIAEGQAILIGDLLLSRVYELGNKQHNFSEKILAEARQNVHTMIEEVILGQMIDVDMMTGEPTSAEMIEKKNMFKTASYTFIRPMLTGAILADAPQETRKLIIALGEQLGLAFQLRDDLMDITAGDETKSLFSDIQEGQQTFFTNYIFTHGNPDHQAILKSSLGRKLSADEITQLQSIFIESGSIEEGKNLIHSHTQKSRQILETIPFTDKIGYDAMIMLIEKIER